MPYHLADTAWSPRRVLQENTSHCFEGATLAAAALRANGFSSAGDRSRSRARHRPRRRRLPHSRPLGRDRQIQLHRMPLPRARLSHPPRTRLSYFDVYFNLRRERSLRTFSRPVNLARFDASHWMTTDQHLWFIAEYCLPSAITRCSAPAWPSACIAWTTAPSEPAA